ncbi:MAG: head GIN domain-containing protein [Candidatus Kapaibacterium sp.]
MKRLLLLSFFAISFIAFVGFNAACNIVHGSGKMASEKRPLTGFTGIEAGGAVDLEVSQSDSYSVEVTADDNILHKITTRVENGTLKIEMPEMDFFDNSTVHVKVSLPKLSALELAGASHGVAKNIKTDKLDLEVSGASKMIITGTAAELNTEVSGASKLDAKELITDNAVVECAGASKATVHANTSLKIEAAGASKVIYSGSAKVTEESSGASSIAQD